MEGSDKIYFDHNASSPLLPEVKIAMENIAHLPLNPSSIHEYGRLARKILEDARNKVSKAISASSKYQVVFTSSGTEANNLAIKGIENYEVVTTTIEHLSILKAVGEGIIPVDKAGVVDLEALRKILANSSRPLMVSVIYASNETGVIQPIGDIVKIARQYGAIVHTDASQALGKIDVNLEELDLDLITLCAHKFGGPVGVGALVFKKDLPLIAIMQGGGQEYRFRPGTQNVVAIHGFGVACEMIEKIKAIFRESEVMRDYLEQKILAEFPESVIFGKEVSRLPNVSSISMPKVENETQVIHFDLNGFAVSGGSACSSGKVFLPYVHMAMGYSEEVASSAIRLSFGAGNTLEQVKQFIKIWRELFIQTNLKKVA